MFNTMDNKIEKKAEEIGKELADFSLNCGTLIKNLYTLYNDLSEDAKTLGDIGLIARLETLGTPDVSCILGDKQSVEKSVFNIIKEVTAGPSKNKKED